MSSRSAFFPALVAWSSAASSAACFSSSVSAFAPVAALAPLTLFGSSVVVVAASCARVDGVVGVVVRGVVVSGVVVSGVVVSGVLTAGRVGAGPGAGGEESATLA